jgi:hypothetical protein
VYSFSNSNVTNDTLLKRLARDTGGQYFNLKTASIDSIAGLIGKAASGIHSVIVEIKQNETLVQSVTDIHPWSPIIGVTGTNYKVIGQIKLPLVEG